VNLKIKKYLLDGEGQQLDFKQSISSASKIARTMVSFANTRGGVLLIGVRDNKTISGVKSEDEKYMLDLAGSFFCRPEIPVKITEHLIEGKLVLEAEIEEGSDKPYYAKDEEGKWWVYVRAADKSLLASKTTVDFLHRKYGEENTRMQVGKLEKGILAYLLEHEKTTLGELCKRFNIGRRRASNIMVNLMAVDLVRSHTIEKSEFFTAVK
jgi:predicted HTH transcriptional regulator